MEMRRSRLAESSSCSYLLPDLSRPVEKRVGAASGHSGMAGRVKTSERPDRADPKMVLNDRRQSTSMQQKREKSREGENTSASDPFRVVGRWTTEGPYML